MRSLVKKVPYLILVACLLSVKSVVAYAEESKNFFSWNSSFIKKANPNKKKGIPANPPKKKLKGIPSQTSKNSAGDELTAEEQKTIQTMSNNANAQIAARDLKTVVRPPALLTPKIPKVYQVPQTPKVPKTPGYYNIRIPSPPTAFSSNSNSNPETPASPSK